MNTIQFVKIGIFLFLTLAVLLVPSSGGLTQGLGVDPTGRGGEERMPLPKELPPLPPPLDLPAPPLGAPGEKTPIHELRVFVREIRITGNTVFSDEELANVAGAYLNRELTTEDLESLRLALTAYYVNRGYINSGAVIPDQTLRDGVIHIQVIEGKLSRVEVDGNRWFRSDYIRSRVALGAGPPLNILALQQQLQILQLDERIQRLNAELRPDVRRGEGVLDIHVQEDNPFKVWLDFNNYQSPTVGAERWQVTGAHQNLSGHGDILSFTYGDSSGIKPQLDISYLLPVTRYDTTLASRYRKNDFTVIEEPFEDLNIDSKSDIYGITLRHPCYRTLHHEFALALMGEHLRNKTFLDGEPFSFSPGAVNGRSVVSALRFSQEYTYRAAAQILAIRSRLSLGVDALGATNNSHGLPDSQFLTWLLQFQWAMRLKKLLDIQPIFRFDLQLATQSLLPLEQIAVGGRYTVRGYRENQLVRDNAVIASLEARIPLVRNRPWADVLELVPFADIGKAWNTDLPTPNLRTLSSVGLGLRWESTFGFPFRWKPFFEVYWGIPLRNVETPGGDLQDDGIHFRFVLQTF